MGESQAQAFWPGRLRVRDYFLSVHRSSDNLARALPSLPFEPYAPVRQQLLNILRAVNRSRKAAGFEPVPLSALRLRRRPVPGFAAVFATTGAGESIRNSLFRFEVDRVGEGRHNACPLTCCNVEFGSVETGKTL